VEQHWSLDDIIAANAILDADDRARARLHIMQREAGRGNGS
jgi:hypothetical protein